MNYYAGIGSRDTPEHILTIMHHIAAYLATQGWTLRSGAASGADASFEEGADISNGAKEIYLPWKGFNHSKSELHPLNYPFTQNEVEFSAKLHPAWNKCAPSARLMHQRNLRQVIGCEQIHGEQVQASKFVVCWTEKGALKGGTAQALRIASMLNVPIFNLGKPKSTDELTAMVEAIDEFQQKMKGKTVIG